MKRWFLAGAIILVGVIALVLLLWPPLHTGFRTRLIEALEEHFKADVSLASLDVSVFPRVTAHGTQLLIKNPDATAPSPLIGIESFEAQATLGDLAARTLRLRHVEMKGLVVHIPPKRVRKKNGSQISVKKIARSDLLIDELVSDESDLVIDTEKPGHSPLIFHIHHLRLQGFGFNRPTVFDATLINPVPPGEVQARGQFGPWEPDEPRLTPLSGDYVLARADLAKFEGLAGHLSSRGSFDGKLEQLAVKGTTVTPDFLLTKSGQPVKLDTVFDAVVDGTNGDTILNQVTATLLHTAIVTKGRVIKVEQPTKGRLIEVNASIDRGRLEDIMHLAVKHDPAPMMGTLTLRTKMQLPPGEGEVVNRLRLEGQFSVQSGRFADDGVQRKIADLSRRGRGEPEAPITDRVFSNLQGSFVMRDGVLRLPTVTFSVEGAQVALAGTYDLNRETLDFAGTLRLQAKPSETVTGFKSLLLKLVDPLFKGKDAGTILPITMQGTTDAPKFGVDVKRALTKR